MKNYTGLTFTSACNNYGFFYEPVLWVVILPMAKLEFTMNEKKSF